MQGKYLSDISIDDILDNIHLTGKEASKNLGLGASKYIHHLEVGGGLLHHMAIAGCVSDEISVCCRFDEFQKGLSLLWDTVVASKQPFVTKK